MGRTRFTGSTGERLLKVLEALIEMDRPASLPELTREVELPKPTVHRLLRLLEDNGYTIKSEHGRSYVPGPVLHRLALTIMQNRPAATARHAALKKLANDVGEACNIVLLDGYEMTYIDRVDTAWPLRLRFEIGSHVPVHCTATGKLLLALQPKRVRDRLLRAIPLQALTSQTITDLDKLEQALAQIRETRIGVDDQEFLPEMVAISAPIDAPQGPPIAAVSIHAPIYRRSLADLYEYESQLRHTAKELSHIMLDSVTTEK